jgi:DNA polymerase III epsilon subunit-like protein
MGKSKHISFDIEADGSLIGTHAMISIGAVIITPELDKTFYREIKPITDEYIPDALKVSGFTREQTLTFMDPKQAMEELEDWILKNFEDTRPILWADNPGFDFAWVNWYMHKYLGRNPFGWSCRRIGDFICGLEKDARYQWKHLRKGFKHTHNALDDAKANAAAIMAAQEKYGVEIWSKLLSKPKVTRY